MIESIHNTIGSYKKMESDWINEEIRKGNDPNKDLSIRTVRMLLDVHRWWLSSEMQLFVAEKKLRTLSKANGAKSRNRKAIKNSKTAKKHGLEGKKAI